MSLNDPIASLLSMMNNAERIGKQTVLVKPVNKLMTLILDKLKDAGYVTSYTLTEDGKGKYMEVVLAGKINKCGVVKPRFPVSVDEYEKFEKRYLPAKNIGLLILSTPQGVMTHEEAKLKNIGGRLLAYCY